jgi:phosphoribosylaminoimidazole-succinocarboxamide synthase
MGPDAVIRSDLAGSLEPVARGKVRDLYRVDEDTLLFVATDRISAYDVVMKTGIPGKGRLLTRMSAMWFELLSKAIPGLQTHFLTLDLPSSVPEALRPVLQERSMVVRKLKVFPIEAIVRGYVTGSAWKEYQANGTVHGMIMPKGLKESEAFPNGPIYTPSTKAEAGKNDENIHPDQAARIVGEKYARRIEESALKLYTVAREYALERGIIIADTKFEFGFDPVTDDIVLIDEALTPDSSRFWSAESYEVGRGQASFDKQHLRDYLTEHGLKGEEGVEIPDAVARKIAAKYQEVFDRLFGRP